jgi:hypothetical protein
MVDPACGIRRTEVKEAMRSMSDPANWVAVTFSGSVINDSRCARTSSEYLASSVAATDCLSGK